MYDRDYTIRNLINDMNSSPDIIVRIYTSRCNPLDDSYLAYRGRYDELTDTYLDLEFRAFEITGLEMHLDRARVTSANIYLDGSRI